ncbi:MAG: hypothetical protein Q8O93_05630 [bacterium]|nr:hypothetical protein [bacterium]
MNNELYQPSVELPKKLSPEPEAPVSDMENQETDNGQTEDRIKDKLYDFLISEGLIMEKDGRIIVDTEMLNSSEFKNKLWNLSLGRNKREHTHIKGTLKLMSEKFGELEAISLADYEREKREGIEAKPEKLFLKEEKLIYKNNREKILHLLKKAGVFEEIGGYKVVDLKQLLTPGFIKTKIGHHKYVRDGEEVFGGQKLVFEELADLPVVSKNDFEAGKNSGSELKPKPLFNVPDSLDEALNLAKAREKNYHLNFWDMGGSIYQQTPWQSSLRLKNGEEIGASEWGLFTKIFVDHQGKRDEDGTLKVFDEEKQTFVRASAEWIDAKIGRFGGGYNKGLRDNPHGFLLNRCPNLIKTDLIKIEDFKIITNSRSGDLLRKEFPMNRTTHNAMINSVSYYIGRDNFKYENYYLPMENVKVVVLDKNQAGIVRVNKGREQLLFTLDLLSEEEKEAKRREVIDKRGDMPKKIITANTVINAQDVRGRIKPYRPTRDNPVKPGEAVEDYAEKIRYRGMAVCAANADCYRRFREV